MGFHSRAIATACLAIAVAACGGSRAADRTPGSGPSAGDGSGTQRHFDAELFASGAIVGDTTTEACTLSGGTETRCARVTVAGYPQSYSVGPFCPDTITTPAQDAGIWFDGIGLYDLSGGFIANLAEFYDDSAWQMYDPKTGAVAVTDTREAFFGAARPDVDPAYRNHCVEGRLEWLDGGAPVETTVLIPVRPVAATHASSVRPGNLGVTLDGIVIAESAPVDAILGAHTIAAFDDCGGHFNPGAGYHLHGAMGCGTLEADAAEGETAVFGYAVDGYPIHLPLEGQALAGADLDECNGHSTPTEGYHYHANDAAKNAVLPCLTGEYVATARPDGPPRPE